MRSTLHDLYFVSYNDFKTHGRLPSSEDGKSASGETIVKKFSDSSGTLAGQDNLHLVFHSYRWLGFDRDRGSNGPDDADGTQYRCMTEAIEALLERESHLKPEVVGIWLVRVNPYRSVVYSDSAQKLS